ncbi:MAG: ribonuclease P protein subunit [Thermoprotei archaeon]|nr:MAG: ribonuclease P protein subunit [Thermoprotei archaeon]
MKITPRNILRHELIGLKAEIIDAKNKCLVGISGLILDETRNMILIGEPGGKKRWVIKEQVVLRIYLPDGKRVRVEGKVLVGRPEDRLKKKIYYW